MERFAHIAAPGLPGSAQSNSTRCGKLTAVSDVRREQIALCQRFSVETTFASDADKVGIALNVRDPDQRLLNGFRHQPESGTSGWYLWAGDALDPGDDFFKPLHVEHIREWRAELLPYLALPPGWRFLIADGHEDAWYDPVLADGAKRLTGAALLK